MAIYFWLSLNDGDVFGGGGANPPSFNPLVDQLIFDDSGISAASVSFTFVSGVSSTFSYGGKTVTLNAAPETLTTTNITFADGSLLIVGDNSTNTANDDTANSLTGGTEDDQLVGLGGNDTLTGGGGNDTAVFSGASGGYSFSLSSGNVRITDTNAGNGDDGADTLLSVESASFTDGTVRIGSLGEFRANSTTTNTQDFPIVAALTGGGFVVTWLSGASATSYHVYAQPYDASGIAVGSEFRVNTYTAELNDVQSLAVAGLADGGFVVVVGANGAGDNSTGIFAQRYDASGIAVGSEFRVNTTTANFQGYSSVATLADGGFVVTWHSNGQDGSSNGIYGQRYDAGGAAVGSEFGVNTTTANDQSNASVAALADGGFVVTWQSLGQDGSGWGIYGQRYDAGGAAVGVEFRVNTTTLDHQLVLSVAALADGGFVVTWMSPEVFGADIYGQRYDAGGAAAGSEFQVNTTSANYQAYPSVAALADGGFVVTWHAADQDGSGYGVYGQRYDAGGAAVGVEFRVNTTTANHQGYSWVAALADGGFVVTWQSDVQGGNVNDIYAQRYDAAGNPVSAQLTGDGGNNVIAWSGAGNVLLDGGAGADTLAGGSGNDSLDGGTGVDSLAGGAGDDIYVIDGADTITEGASAGTDLVRSSVTYTLGTNLENLTLTGTGSVNGTGNTGNNVLTGNSAVNVLDGGSGDDTLIGGGAADALEGGAGNDLFIVDSAGDTVTDASGTDTIQSSVSYTLPANVEHLVLTKGAITGSGNTLNNLLIGNSAANTLVGDAGNDSLQGNDGDDLLNGGSGNDTLDGGSGNDAAVFSGASSGYSFSLAGGNIVVTDTNAGNGNDGADTLLSVENASFTDGMVKIGSLGEFQVNSATAYDQAFPIVAALTGGGYVVTWLSGDGIGTYRTYAQRYDASGIAVGSEFQINTNTSTPNDIFGLAVSGLADGGFVVVMSGNGAGDSTGIFAQRYDASGIEVGSEFRVNTTTAPNFQTYSSVATLADGGFVVTWTSDGQDGSSYGIYGQRYDAGGAAVGVEFRVNTTTANEQSTASVAALPGGGFVVTWQSDGQDGSSYGIYGQRYDAGGAAVGVEFRINSTTANDQLVLSLAALPGGGFVVTWMSPDGSSYGIYGQRYDAGGAAVGGEFRVNTTTANYQAYPSVAALADGGFVVTWHSDPLSNYGVDIYAQRYDASGNAVGSEFLVNTTTANIQGSSSVAALSDGGFVVTWQSDLQDGSSYGVYAQRYDAAGNPVSVQLTGDDGNNVIAWSGAGNVILDGGAGNDTLTGGTGNDRLIGGADTDTASYASAQAGVTVSLAAAGPQATGSAGTDTLVNIENLLGSSFGDRLAGNASANLLSGAGGDDTLVAGTGADTLDGGAGSDFVDFSGAAFPVSFNLASGTFGSTTLVSIENAIGSGFGDTLTGDANANVIDGGAGADSMAGGPGSDRYLIDNAADSVTENASEGVDQVDSSITYTLAGNVENLLLTGAGAINGTGNALANQITGNSGANVLAGGGDNDTLTGGGGNDIFVIAGGNGTDLITDYSPGDALRITGVAPVFPFTDGNGSALLANEVQISAAGGTTTLFIGLDGTPGADLSVLLTGTFAADDFRLDDNDIVVNRAPIVANPIPDSAALTGNPYVFQVSVNAFADPDTGDTLVFTATLSDDSPLPAWVTFNAGTRTFSGTPAPGDLGSIDVKVTATDLGGLSVQDTFALNVQGSNAAPAVNAGISDQGATEDALFTFVFPANAFSDPDGDSLTYSATKGDGSALPGWLGFNAATRTFSGTPANGEVGAVTVKVTASDPGTLATFDTFVLTVQNTNDAPTVSNPVANQNAQADSSFNFIVPANTFADVDVGDSISYAATKADGSSLPSWLNFDTGTRTFSGTPAPADEGSISIKVTATDQSSASGFATFSLNVAPSSSLVTGTPGNDTLDGGSGADVMIGYEGNDTYIVENFGDVCVEQNVFGDDLVLARLTYTLSNFIERLTLDNVAGAANGTGNALINILQGNTFGNRLDGGLGDDTLIGKQGDDTYLVDSANDLIIELPGEGTDTVESIVSYDLSSQSGTPSPYVEGITLTGTANINATGNALDNTLSGNPGNNRLVGGGGNDTLIGGEGTDTADYSAASGAVTVSLGGVSSGAAGADSVTGIENLIGSGHADALTGDAIANVLNGGAGNDTLTGNAGNDTYIVDSAMDVVQETAGGGTADEVQASVSYSLGTGQDIENLTLTGSSAINGTGNELANFIRGTDAANVLDGGAGGDTLEGGDGNDTYIVDSAGDVIREIEYGVFGDGGVDVVQASVSFTNLGSGYGVEIIILTGSSPIDATGSAFDNEITGNDAANKINGNGGADTMAGGAGDDSYIVVSGTEVVIENAGGGTDAITSLLTTTNLPAYVENLLLSGSNALSGFGNSQDNFLTGNVLANVLDGGPGNDTMMGGKGDDVYFIDSSLDRISELLGEGNDTAFVIVSYLLPNHVEYLKLLGTADINGTGNFLSNIIEGNAGNNILNGGLNDDIMIGGAGDDVYKVDNPNDLIIENPDEGIDRVESSISYDLSANVENLTLENIDDITLLGTGDNAATGNELKNVLIGNTGHNLLDGRGNDDTMTGGLGNDSYIVEEAGDVVTELAGQGTDLVRTTLTSYTLGNDFENLTLEAGAVNGTGNELDNIIIGNDGDNSLVGGDGNDTLDGGQGADTMVGGAGNDSYYVDNAGDQVVEQPDEGQDDAVFVDFSDGAAWNNNYNFTLPDHVEDAFFDFISLGQITEIVGNALDNLLQGNDGQNVLDGGGGNDTLEGGKGDDTYVVEESGDLVLENGGEGVDAVQSFIDYGVGANVENLQLMGTAVQGTGNGLNNQIVGNAGNNVLDDGGAGADTLSGGAGNDFYVVHSSIVVLDETGGSGHDTVQTYANLQLAGGLDDAILAGFDNINVQGNDLENVFTSNTGNNLIDGGAGVDRVSYETAVIGVNVNLGDAGGQGQGSGGGGADILINIEGVLGSNYNDTLVAGTGDNTLDGGLGRDTLDGGAGADSLVGGAGNDLYYVDDAGDEVIEIDNDLPGGLILPGLSGGIFQPGLQVIFIAGITDTVIAAVNYSLANLDYVEHLTLTGTATEGTGNLLANELLGNTFANLLLSLDGDDYLAGAGSNDTLDGGAGNDTLDGGADNDTLDGGADNDSLTGGLGADNAQGNAGIDTLIGNAGNDTLDGGADADLAYGSADHDSMMGAAGIDTLVGNAGNDTINGGADDDQAFGSVGDDYVLGGLGADVVQGNAGNDTVIGGDGTGTDTADGNDSVDGGAGNDSLSGGFGNDNLVAGAGFDTLIGNAGDDTLDGGADGDLAYGSAGDDSVVGGAGADTLVGNAGNDLLNGGTENDQIFGSTGNDVLVGGTGNDTMQGNAGTDTFRYDAATLNTLDVAAGQADFVTASAAGDLISMLGLIDEITIGNVALSALTANTLVGNALNAANNIAFTGGVLQIDLDGNDVFNALNDFQVQLTGVATVIYNATDDLFYLA